MYVGAERAMRHRRRLEDPEGGISIMQQPDLGRLGRFVGPHSLTLGDIGTIVDPSTGLPPAPAVASTSSFSLSPWMIGGGLLLLGFLWYRSRSGGGGGHILPRGIGKKFTNAIYIGGAVTGGYLLGKYL